MRKFMTKDVTQTTVQVAKIEMVEGKPVATTLPQLNLLGNVSLEKAQKEAKKLHGEGVSVFEVQADTTTYQLSVEDFMKYAHVKPEPIEGSVDLEPDTIEFPTE